MYIYSRYELVVEKSWVSMVSVCIVRLFQTRISTNVLITSILWPELRAP